MLRPFLLLAQTTITLKLSQLRWELIYFAAGSVLLVVGLTAITLFLVRRKSRETTLVYFGLFTSLYAVRLLLPRLATGVLFDLSPRALGYLQWGISATLILPFGLFLYQVAGERWRKLFRWLLAMQAAFVLVGVPAAILGASLRALIVVNNIVVLTTVTVTVVFFAILRWRVGTDKPISREIRIFLAGFAIWISFVVNENIHSLYRNRGHDVEFVGFLIFTGFLGYITVRRMFANEEQLFAIGKELEIARQIQSSTLPQEEPRLPGLEIAARYVPMSAVAGDFYDFLVVDDKHIGILIADVTGHGVPAALIASMLKVAFGAQLAHAADPARVLTGLNRSLCGKFDEHFVTAAYLFLDLEANRIRYAAAGHPPMMLTSTNGAVRQVEHNGLMLGLFPDAVYSATELPLIVGDRCVLYTDGIPEAADTSREEFGKARIQQSIEKNRRLSAGSAAAALLDEVARWSGHAEGQQDDDITLVVLDFHDSRSGPEPAINMV
jgi:phosphoserine phosphatase RsbU/P